MNGSGRWRAARGWLGQAANCVLSEVEDGRFKTITHDVPASDRAVRLEGWTIPGLANVPSHAFQPSLRGAIESGGGDFWEWRQQMYRAAAQSDWTDYFKSSRFVFREMLEAGITAV